MRVKVAGKINLDLYVTGTKDGLHTLDSVMASVSVYDWVSVRKARRTTVIENGKVADTDCPAYRALKAFADTYGPVNVKIRIKKGIPFSSGMGGSSADSAAILACLCTLFNKPLDPMLALKAGSDTPFMLYGGIMRVQGVGEILTPLAYKKQYFLLAKQGHGLAAKDVYRRCDELGTAKGERHTDYSVANFDAFLADAKNELYDSVASLSNVDAVREMILRTNPEKVQLTGSGPAFFATYADKKALKNAYKSLKTLGLDAVKIIHTKKRGITLI